MNNFFVSFVDINANRVSFNLIKSFNTKSVFKFSFISKYILLGSLMQLPSNVTYKT